MKRLLPYSVVGLLVLACSAEPPAESGARIEETRIEGEMQPDQVARLPAEVVFKKLRQGGILLVCAYETEVAFRAARLEGAISFAQFTKLLPTLEAQQELVFYCA